MTANFAVLRSTRNYRCSNVPKLGTVCPIFSSQPDRFHEIKTQLGMPKFLKLCCMCPLLDVLPGQLRYERGQQQRCKQVEQKPLAQKEVGITAQAGQ